MKYYILVGLFLIFSLTSDTVFATNQNTLVTIDLADDAADNIGDEPELFEGGGPITSVQEAEKELEADAELESDTGLGAYGSGDDSKSPVRVDISGDDPYILEEYSPNDYNTYDFTNILPVQFETENKAQAYITNRANRLTLAKVDATLYTKEEVRGQNTSLGLTEYGVQASVPILYKGQNKLMFTVNYGMSDFDTDMRLKNDNPLKYDGYYGAKLPNQLQSLSFMTNYRYDIENTEIANGFFNGTTVGVDVIVDSRSDELFNSLDETNLTALVSYRIPIFENQAITLMAGYVSDYKLPIGGIGYQLNFGETSYFNVGIPLNMVHVNSKDIPGVDTERFNFDFNYVVLGDLHTQLSYDIILGKLQVYTDFEWNTSTWARAARADKRSRIFYTECRWGGGVRADFLKYFYAQAEGGWAFARNIYEDRNFFQYNKGWDINNAAYLKLEAGIVF